MISPKLIIVAASAAVFATLAGVVAFQRSQIDKKNAEIVALQLSLKQSQDAAQICSDSVADLRKQSDEREKKGLDAIEAAKANALKAKSKADKILSTPPSVPGNDCQSASDRVNEWLKDRSK